MGFFKPFAFTIVRKKIYIAEKKVFEKLNYHSHRNGATENSP